MYAMKPSTMHSFAWSLGLAVIMTFAGGQAAHAQFACDSVSHACDELPCDAMHQGLCDREKLFGDWLGLRPHLHDSGIDLDAELTQFYQGVASGGAEQRFRYGSKFNLYLNADSERMGLWKGGKLIFHAAEWQFGQNSINDAVGLAPVNANLLLPAPEPSFAITHLQFIQSLGGGWAATFGRYNLIDLWQQFYPDYGRGLDGFMNLASLIPVNSIAPTVPPVSNVFGVLKSDEGGPQFGFLVVESGNSGTTVGLDFPNGVTLVGVLRRNTKLAGLAGSHMILATYATGEYTSFDVNDFVIIPPGVPEPGERTGSWFAGYYGEQRLWQDPCDKKRYTKLYGFVGFADQETSPYEWSSAITWESFGALRCRPRDRAGIGYFYNRLNADFRELFSATTPVDDVHGGEVYYNMEVNPWLHITADLQAIRPEIAAQDTAIICALRAKIDF